MKFVKILLSTLFGGVLMLALPGVAHAGTCSGGGLTFSAFDNSASPISNLVPNGTVVTESAVKSLNISCSGYYPTPQEIKIYVTGTTTAGTFQEAIRYNGQIYYPGDVIHTGVITGSGQAVTGTLSLLIVKVGPLRLMGSAITSFNRIFLSIGPGDDHTPQAGAATNTPVQWSAHYFQEGTCSVRTGDKNRAITLPPVTMDRLSTLNQTTGRTDFSLKVENCGAKVKFAQFIFSGTPDTDNPQAFRNTGTAKGIGLRLGSALDDSTITPTGTLQMRARLVPVVGTPGSGTATMPLFVEYIRTGTPFDAGDVAGHATLMVDYQ